MNNPYEVLGIEPDATPEQVKSAYRQMARAYHPDNGGDGEGFIEIAMAYDTLRDPNKRETYDRTGKVDKDAIAADRQSVGELLSMALDAVIEKAAGRNLSETDIVKDMKVMISDGENGMRNLVNMIASKISKYEDINRRIKRNDEEKNIFSNVFVGKIDHSKKEKAAIEKELFYAAMALEELDGYESIVDVVRTYQASWFYAGTGRVGVRQMNLDDLL